MKTKTLRVTLITVGLLLLAAGAVYAQAAGFQLAWWTVDGGGGRSTGEGLALSGSIGQPDAGTITGGGYRLSGGFWASTGAGGTQVYLPIVAR